jgi:serine protease Do
MVLQIKDALLKDGRVVRGWLGVALQDVDAALARAIGAGDRRGVLVTEVAPDGPAAKAGLQRGDLIVAVDGTPMVSTAPLRNHVALKGKGARVALDVVRRGEERRVAVVLDELPDDSAARGGAPAPRQGREEDDERDAIAGGPLVGVVVAQLDAALRRELGLERDVRGVLVVRAPRAGALRRGDVIVEIDRVPTPTVDAFRAAARDAGEEMLLLVHRRGRTMFLLLSPR